MSALDYLLFNERMVGRGHPTLADTTNRALRSLLSQSGYDPDANPFPGLMGPVYNVNAFGAIGNGVTDDTAAIHAARDTAGVGGRIYVPPGTYSITGLTANVANQLWELAPTATLKVAAGTSHVLTITAAGVTVRGGTFDGNQSNMSGVSRGISVEPTSASPACTVRDLVVQNVYDDGIFFFQAHDSQCLNNRVSAIRGNGISGRNSQRVLVQGNYMDGSGGGIVSGSDCIAFAATTAGQTIDGCQILNNTLLPGAQSSNFGVELQVTSGDVSHNCVVANNVVKFAAACSGGISLSGMQHCVMQGNTIEANGQAASVDAIELAACTFCTVGGNVLKGGTTGWNQAIGLDRSSNCTVQGNIIDGGSTAASLSGIKIGSSTAATAQRNIITNNRILLPSAATATRGIYVQANNAGADCSDNILALNEIECSGDATSQAISLDQSAGTLQRTQIAYNSFRNCNEGIRRFNDTDTLIGPNKFVSCTKTYGTATPGAGGRKVEGDAISADRGDTSVTLVLETDEPTQLFATTLTANRTVTLPASARTRGARFRVVRTGLGAFTLDVGGLKTIPSATAAFVDVIFDGANWKLAAYGTL